MAAPLPARAEAERDGAGAGFEYELEEVESLLKLLPTPLAGLAALAEIPPPWGLSAWRTTTIPEGGRWRDGEG